MRVALVGPASPRDVADLLTGADRTRAADLPGYRGIPTTELARGLLCRGAEVELITVAPEVSESLELSGHRFRMLVAPQRPRARHRALDLFRAERAGLTDLLKGTSASVIHALWTYEFAWAALLEPSRPVLVTAHDAPLTVLRHLRDPYRAVRAAMAYVVRTRLRHLVAVSPYLAGRWRREMCYWRDIAVIPNSVPHLESVGGYRRARNRVVEVADASARKNVCRLLQATRILKDQGRPIELELIGPGLGPNDQLAERALELGVSDAVSFRGELDRRTTAEALRGASAFVHASLEESFGLSIVEALAAAVPVVAGESAGAVPWLLKHGAAGLLVDVRDPQAIANGIAAVLDDADLASTLTVGGLRRVADFTSERVADAYLDEYERAVGVRA